MRVRRKEANFIAKKGPGVSFEYFRNSGYQPKNHGYVKLKFVKKV